MTAFLRRRSLNRGSPSTIVSAFLDSLLTTRGQIIRRGSSAPEALALGASGTLLRSDGTDAGWASVDTALASLLTARGQIIRRGSSAPEALAAQTANTFLGGDGTDVTTRTAAQVRSSLSIVTGTWTPTLTNTTNVAASTAIASYYIRVEDQVFFWGSMAIDPTASGSTILGMSLPIASNFGASSDARGAFVAISSSIAYIGGGIYADTVNDRLTFSMSVVDTNNREYAFSGGYRII